MASLDQGISTSAKGKAQPKHGTKLVTPKVGDVVIVKNDERNRVKWHLGVIVHLLTGKDGFVRGAKLRTAKGSM